MAALSIIESNRRHHCLQTLFLFLKFCNEWNKRIVCFKNHCASSWHLNINRRRKREYHDKFISAPGVGKDHPKLWATEINRIKCKQQQGTFLIPVKTLTICERGSYDTPFPVYGYKTSIFLPGITMMPFITSGQTGSHWYKHRANVTMGNGLFYGLLW